MVQVPMAYVLAISLGVGPVGVFWSVFTADMLSCLVGVIVFRRGKWKTRTV
jgi:Na+-driven multidrug efflux pump